MAGGISDLFNNVIGSVEGLGVSLGLLPGKPSLYPDTAPINATNSTITSKNWNKSFPYSFAVMGDDGQAGKFGFGTFTLPLAPSELSQDEIPAITIKTTQGGTIVNRGRTGIRYKDLVIAGTTGIAPFRGAGGVDRSTGKAIFQPDELKYKSGFEVFLILRNWFKSFYQFKSSQTEPLAKSVRLVFQNFKDGEFLVVELLRFSLKKSAQRKFLYDYTLTFKVLKHLTFVDTKPGFLQQIDNLIDSAKTLIDDARGTMLRSQDILRQVESTYENTVVEPLRKMSLATKAFLGIAPLAADLGRRAVKDTVTQAGALATLLGLHNNSSLPAQSKAALASLLAKSETAIRKSGASDSINTSSTIDALFTKSDILMQVPASVLPSSTQSALSSELAEAKVLPRKFYEDSLADLKRIRDNAVDKFNLGSSTYNSMLERVPTLVADSTKVVSDAEFLLLDAFNKSIKGIEYLLSSNALFESSYSDRIQAIQDAFGGDVNISADAAMREIVFPHDTDLETLALRELGDTERWVEIAELNNLKPPYIIEDLTDPTPNVIHPGDKILIPQPITNGFGSTPAGRPTYFKEKLSETERNLGVDLRIDDGFDLIMNNQGDLALSYGLANAAQAIKLKLAYEPGDLVKHPNIGVGLEPGVKFPDLSDIKMSLIRTLTQDPRFESVTDIALVQNNSELRLNFTIHIKQVDTPVAISLKL